MTALWEQVCGCLNGYEGRMCDFLPLALGMGRPAGGVFVGDGMKTKEYADGSVLCRIPFEVRLRVSPRTVRERLRVLASLEGMGQYVSQRDCSAPLENGLLLRIGAEGMPKRVLAADSGEEEYKMNYYVITVRRGDGDGLQN